MNMCGKTGYIVENFDDQNRIFFQRMNLEDECEHTNAGHAATATGPGYILACQLQPSRPSGGYKCDDALMRSREKKKNCGDSVRSCRNL